MRWVVTVTVSVEKIKGLNWGGYERIPTNRDDPGRTFVGYVLPISIVKLDPRLHRLLYHLPHLIHPEWRVSRGDGRDR